MSKAKHFKGFSIYAGDIKANVKLSRFEAQYKKAQYELDGQVMNDMVPYMPHESGTFINETRAYSASMQGTGKVAAAFGPQGRYLYNAKLMVDPETGSPWARKGAKKVVTAKDLTFSNPRAAPFWFDVAKKNHSKEWVRSVKKNAGGN